jgi:hypothetical protein
VGFTFLEGASHRFPRLCNRRGSDIKNSKTLRLKASKKQYRNK